MKAYCESDVKLLKAGCREFREEFKQKADFDPMEKCVTMASACNRFWRKKLVPKNKIASIPSRGWHGSRSNQSVKALKRLAWQEHQLREQHPATGDRIRTVGNGGACARPVPGGRVRPLRSRHSTPHRLRIPRMSLARVSQMLSSSA